MEFITNHIILYQIMKVIDVIESTGYKTYKHKLNSFYIKKVIIFMIIVTIAVTFWTVIKWNEKDLSLKNTGLRVKGTEPQVSLH